MGDITIFGQNSLNLNFEHCVNKILNRKFKERLIVILRPQVEPKYSTTDFYCVSTAKLENVGPTFSSLNPSLSWSSAGENIR